MDKLFLLSLCAVQRVLDWCIHHGSCVAGQVTMLWRVPWRWICWQRLAVWTDHSSRRSLSNSWICILLPLVCFTLS